MRKPSFFYRAAQAGLLLGLVLAGPLAPAQTAPAAAAHPVETLQPGKVVGLFVATGDWVKRGQLLVKLKKASGESFFASAPVTGRVVLLPLPLNSPLPAHTVLATVTPTP